ncbi:MAG TPA: hypothetical protein VFG05_07765 [Methylocella sp.]|nr:hypothetical protein [Methylocella sp.]
MPIRRGVFQQPVSAFIDELKKKLRELGKHKNDLADQINKLGKEQQIAGQPLPTNIIPNPHIPIPGGSGAKGGVPPNMPFFQPR